MRCARCSRVTSSRWTWPRRPSGRGWPSSPVTPGCWTRAARLVSVREALALINETLDEALAEQEGDFDADTRWALAWFDQSGFSDGEYGVGETLSTAKNTSVAGMVEAGILTSGGGKVRLLAPAELPQDWDPKADSRRTVWETTHHLVRVHEQGGDSAAADIMAQHGCRRRDFARLGLPPLSHLRPAQPSSRGAGLQRPGPQLGGNLRFGNSGASGRDPGEYAPISLSYVKQSRSQAVPIISHFWQKGMKGFP